MRIIPNTAEAARYCDTLVSTSALASTVLGAALVGVDRGRVKLRELVERRRSRPVVVGCSAIEFEGICPVDSSMSSSPVSSALGASKLTVGCTPGIHPGAG